MQKEEGVAEEGNGDLNTLRGASAIDDGGCGQNQVHPLPVEGRGRPPEDSAEITNKGVLFQWVSKYSSLPPIKLKAFSFASLINSYSLILNMLIVWEINNKKR